MRFSGSRAGSGNLIDESLEDWGAFLTGPGMFSTTGESLLHSAVRAKSVEFITIPFHTWREGVLEEE